MLLKDPLVHFLAVGGLLFAFFWWHGTEPPPDRIVISADRIAELRQAATLLEGRPPTEEELTALVEPAIREEVYYREALALGLDENDDEVRRRLVEKMQYLSQDIADPEPASDASLREFYEANAERFRIPERVSFDQVFFSPRQRGESVQADAEAALAALRGGADPASLGDSTPLESRFTDAARERVLVLFGESLTDAVFAAEPGVWIGPYRSDFGLHLIRLVAREPARQPPFDEVEDQVRQVFADDKRRAANEAAYAAIRARYDVVVEWPAQAADETAR